MTIGLCTDSNAQLPPELILRYRVEVVPLTVTVDGIDHAEGEDLDADAFYAHFLGDETPVVTTSQPSPGRFLLAYERLAAAGASQILSVHIGSSLSGTLNAARLAAGSSPVPVRLVDTGTASFGIACCLWEAAEAVRDGAGLEAAARVAESVAPTIGNVFIVKALDLVRAGGRMASSVAFGAGEAFPVLTLRDGQVQVVASAATVDEAVDAMAQTVTAWGDDLRVAVGLADAAGAPVSEALVDALAAAPSVRETLLYRIGPSVGAHTGPGTAGAFFFPATPRS